MCDIAISRREETVRGRLEAESARCRRRDGEGAARSRVMIWRRGRSGRETRRRHGKRKRRVFRISGLRVALPVALEFVIAGLAWTKGRPGLHAAGIR